MNRIKLKSISKDSVVIFFISVCFLFLVEGISSFMIVFYDLWENPKIIAEKVHTEYDPMLGWINSKTCFIQDMYGPGVYLRTNSQRFRNNHDFDIESPNGQRRWICAGDSFTFGYGVDNDHTWCSLLSSYIPNIETVNMGQGGYGIGQAYLWYMRDGVQLQHHVLILAFITYDFDRMTRTRSGGYSRPRLNLIDGQIIQQNYPVKRPNILARSLPGFKSAIRELSVVRMMNFIGRKLQSSKSEPGSKLIELTQSIFGDLNQINNHSNRTVLLVHLPSYEDYKGSENSDIWRTLLHSDAEIYGWNYIDLIEEFRDLNPESVPQLFIQNDLPGYVASSGHYTEEGHQYIAELLAKKIAGNPALGNLIQSQTPE